MSRCVAKAQFNGTADGGMRITTHREGDLLPTTVTLTRAELFDLVEHLRVDYVLEEAFGPIKRPAPWVYDKDAQIDHSILNKRDTVHDSFHDYEYAQALQNARYRAIVDSLAYGAPPVRLDPNDDA
jgi:hypothetical protein